MAVSSCWSQKVMSFSTCSSFECRSDPDFSGSARFEKPRISAARAIGLSTATFSGVPSLIFRFPPNFVRQLSTKARRNCSNIGVAQIVAASWSNGAGSGSNSVASAAASAVPAPPVPVEIATGDDVEVVDGLNNVQLEALADLKNEASFLSSDGSLAIHAGERLGRGIVTDAITTPVVNTSAYFFKKTAELIDFKEKRRASFEYGRYGNPTTVVVEEKISALEGAESTVIMASGMCASTVLLLALVPAGGHIVTTTDCYRKTRIFIETVLPKMGITATVIDPADMEGLEAALNNNNVSRAFIYDTPQKHASQSTNSAVLSHCPSLHKGNVNGNHNLNFLNVDVTNIEKHNRNFDSESLSRPHAEYPFACKHSRTGPLDVYSNETIPAMHLLSLMDAGLQSGAPMDIDGNRKFLKRPSFPHGHHSKDFSGLSSGGYKPTSTVKPSPYDYYANNHLSDSRDCFQTVGASGFSFPRDKVVKKTTGFTGQASLQSQERNKAKASHSPSQNKDNRSKQPVFLTGGSGTSHGTIPVHNMQKMFVGASDSLVFPLTFHERENATKQKLESRNTTGTVLPPKSSSKTETCSINRNPADFSTPEAGNIYMIRGEDLKYRKTVFSKKRSGLIKSDGRKRQKRLNAVKGNV